MTARLLDISTADYHADVGSGVPRLSASIARELVAKSPLHAWQIHPRLGGTPRAPTEKMDAGSLVHALLLGDGMDEFAVIDVADFRTKAAQALRDAAIEQGKTVIKAADLARTTLVVNRLRERLTDIGIDLTGTSEMKVEWTETVAGETVLCRGMMDHVIGPQILDLKTTTSADLKSCARHVIEYGYDIQGAAYVSALGKLHPELRGRGEFVAVFLETEPPYAVTPVRFDGTLRELGQRKWERAVKTWGQCLRTGIWPGYVGGITQIEAPTWALMDTVF